MLIFILLVLLVISLIFAFLYFSLRLSIKRLRQDIATKRQTQENRLLTHADNDRALAALIREINAVFNELQAIHISSQQEKKTFDLALHNITHDIRTPLTIASGYTQSLLKNDPAQAETLGKIKQNLDTVSKRLEILLEYQNLLEMEGQPDLERVNLTEILTNELLNDYESLTEKNFDVAVALDTDYFIQNKHLILERIFQNLLGNVLKHGKNSLSIQLEPQADRLYLTIKNESQQEIRELEKLTNRFYSENLSAIENSSGLGLYIAKELVEMTAGSFDLDYQAPDFIARLSWKLDE